MKNIFSRIYAILWSAIWWLLVMSAGTQIELFTYVAAAAIVLTFVYINKTSTFDILTPLCALICGLFVDSLFMHTELITYHSVLETNLLPPPWILFLWVFLGIGIVIYHKLLSHHRLSILFVCLLAPLCYWAAARMEAISFNLQPMSLTLSLIAVAYVIASIPLYLSSKRGGIQNA